MPADVAAPRWFPVPGGYAVAEETVPVALAREIQRLFQVRHERTFSVHTVMQHPPVPGRWGHDVPWYSCGCALPYCAHINAVLQFIGGPPSDAARAVA